jgi:uncharacterized protein
VSTFPARHAAVTRALQRLVARRDGRSSAAARVREHVLGAPALTPDVRAARIAAAARLLDLSCAELEEAMWADLPGERLVSSPDGRPDELALAAAANVELVQRAFRRAFEVEIEIWGDPRPVMRVTAFEGLLATATARPDGATLIEISGPLTLFHRTTVYGRALGSLVFALAWCERFRIAIRCDVGGESTVVHVASPLLLPPPPAPRVDRGQNPGIARLARDLAAAGWRAVREPAAIAAADGHLLFPDLRIEHAEDPDRGWWLEIVGFWTAEYLARKLERYRASTLDPVILCLDARRAVAEGDLPSDARIVRFRRHPKLADVVAAIG